MRVSGCEEGDGRGGRSGGTGEAGEWHISVCIGCVGV